MAPVSDTLAPSTIASNIADRPAETADPIVDAHRVLQWANRRFARQLCVTASFGDAVLAHVANEAITELLEAVIEPHDRVCLEGNNQKQADFLARALTQVDPRLVHDLHMVQSVLALPETGRGTSVVLQPGTRQLAAGYAIYGPSTQVVLTVGRGTHGFTLDREIGNFVLTHPDIRVPDEGSDYLINASNRRFWEPPVARYVDECKAGKEGPRGRDFNTRWVASMVADVHRILLRGGVYMYPRDQKAENREGRLRLLYEANPMAMIVEQAGGAASTGRGRILEVVPERIHQRVPVVLGSRSEVARVERYHAEYDRGEDKPYSSPLFGERSLFRSG